MKFSELTNNKFFILSGSIPAYLYFFDSTSQIYQLTGIWRNSKVYPTEKSFNDVSLKETIIFSDPDVEIEIIDL